MDKIKKDLNENNSFLFSSISRMYSDTMGMLNEAYLIGKKDSYEEMLNLLYIFINNNGIKYLSPNNFQSFLTDRQHKTKISKNNEDINKCYECKRKYHKVNQIDSLSMNNPFYINDGLYNIPNYNNNIQNNFYSSNSSFFNNPFDYSINNTNNSNNDFNSNTYCKRKK